MGYPLQYSGASLVAQLVKNLSAIQETWVQSLSWDDPLEKRKGCPLQCSGLENSTESQRVGLFTTELLSLSDVKTVRSFAFPLRFGVVTTSKKKRFNALEDR